MCVYCQGPLTVIYNIYVYDFSGVHLYPLFVLYSMYIFFDFNKYIYIYVCVNIIGKCPSTFRFVHT